MRLPALAILAKQHRKWIQKQKIGESMPKYDNSEMKTERSGSKKEWAYVNSEEERPRTAWIDDSRALSTQFKQARRKKLNNYIYIISDEVQCERMNSSLTWAAAFIMTLATAPLPRILSYVKSMKRTRKYI